MPGVNGDGSTRPRGHVPGLALADLGIPPVAILSGDQREPLWPAGVVGAITHCDDYRAAAVARATDIIAIGIDAEPHDAVPQDVARRITRPEEVDLLVELIRAAPQIHWDRLLLRAKESAYKAWFPLTNRWLDFQDALVTPELNADLVVRLLVPAPARLGPVLHGRWLTRNGLLLTAVMVTPATRHQMELRTDH